jgi:hypothetical protein
LFWGLCTFGVLGTFGIFVESQSLVYLALGIGSIAGFFWAWFQ